MGADFVHPVKPLSMTRFIICALVPLSGKGLNGYTFDPDHLKSVNVPIWALCGDADPEVGILASFKLIKENVPGTRTTSYKGGMMDG